MKHSTVSFNYFYKIHTVSITILQYIMNFINLDKVLPLLFGIVERRDSIKVT